MASIEVRALRTEDLPHCSWAGSALHLRQVGRELARADGGEVSYRVVCVDDQPVSIGGVDFTAHPGQAMLWQLATDERHRSQGFGTVLVRALENDAATAGFHLCRLGVETDNPRARRLYERLGYRATGEIEHAQWDEEEPAGGVRQHHAEVVVLTRAVDGPRWRGPDSETGLTVLQRPGPQQQRTS